MAHRSIAAAHMVSAFKVLFQKSTSTLITKLPSGGVMLRTGEPDPFGNLAVGLVGSEYSTVADQLLPRDAPSAIVVPSEDDHDVGSAVSPFGFALAASIPGMVADLGEVREVEIPANYRLTRVSSEECGEEWANLLSLAYPVAPKAARLFSPVEIRVGDAIDEHVQFFQAKHGDVVVASSVLVIADEVAGVYSVSTHPDHRRKGLGAALTAKAMNVAKDLGYGKAVLQASESGYSTYKRLGFEDESKVNLYLRMPS